MSLVCAAWGPLAPGRFVHMDCPVVIREAHEACKGAPACTARLPMVCECECQTCKRAWWAEGRPVLRGDTIVFDK